MNSSNYWKVWALCLVAFFPVLARGQVTANFSGSPLSGCSPLVVQFTDQSTGPVTNWSWDFGNGNTSTLQNPAAVYVTPGTYTVTLTVSGGGFNDAETRVSYITVFQNPTAALVNSSPRNGCAPLTVCFNDISIPGSGAINGWLWDFGDGNTATTQAPCHTYAAAGNYTVSLVVTDVNGCNNTVVMLNYVSVSTPPTAAFSGAPLSACSPPLNVTFTNTSTGGAGPLSYQWDFGDGGSSTLNSPTHTYNATGAFTITLIATDANGCTDTLIRNAYVNIGSVTAAFSPSTTVICEGQSVTFTDNSTGNPNAWQWDFGDGGSSTAQNPTHAYATAGTYTVSLIATNGACGDTFVQTALITVNPAPVANFLADTTQSCAVPLLVNFTDLSTGNPTSWLWDFGDGNTSTAQNPSHTYTAPGTYTVSLSVTGPNGCTDAVTFNNYIQITEPVADFVGMPIMGCIPLPVAFTDLSTSIYPIISWQWDFGDGNTSNAQNPNHVYTTPGAFTVSLIIINAAGCTDTLIRPVYIQAGTPPVACFTVNPTVACVNDPVNFTDCSTNATGWFWDFGDGGTSNAQNPTYAYQDTGCFTVTLIASNFGCTDDTIIQNVVCITPPLARFNLNPATACGVPLLVTFTDNSILPDTWLWDFGDGNTSTLQNPTHTYIALGTYNVTLTVSDTVNGCSDDAQATVTITDPVANFTGGPLFGCGPLTVNFTDLSTGATTWAWDFGDGGTSNAQNPSHTYQNPGTYTVTLVIGDNNGCSDTHTEVNFVQVIGPAVDFVGLPLTGCDSITVNFTDLTVPGAPITGWQWDFGDGNTSTLQHPSHTYLPGNWTVSLTVTDAVGCSRNLTRNNYIRVQDPQANFTINDTITCAGVALNFTNASTGNGLTYSWDFGDGNGATVQNPNHTYAVNGNYTVTLAVQDNLGCQDTIAFPNLVTISDVLADFGANPTNASCPPLLVSFTDSSFWDIVSWDWDFGDLTGSTLQNPAHVYATAGSYDVSLSVVNDDGCRDTLLLPGLINILGPNGNFTFDPDTGCTPQLVHFNATATNTASYTWDFGDGTVAVTTADSVDHVYTQTGIFYPILILDDGMGCTFSILSPDSIIIDTIPFVNFAVNVNVLCGLDSVRFTDLTFSTQPITAWFWDFGDGNTSTQQNPVHFYATPGNYPVTLGVVNAFGCTDTITLPANVSVFLPPNANFIPSDTIGCDPLLVNFTDASTGAQPITTWNWDFGNGNTANVQNPTQLFVGSGGYAVTLIVIDSAGCRDTVSRNIVVNPGPIADFVADDSVGCPPLPVQFTATTGMGIISWQWDFGDGSFGAGSNTGHVYPVAGNYTVTLIVTDTLGCTDTLVKPQYIQINPPLANFTQGPTSGCPPLTVSFTDNSTGTNGIVQWDWNFGDGNTGTGTPVSHTYLIPGVYTVTLIVTDAQGCRDTLVKPNLVNVFAPPIADFGIIDTTLCDPFTVQFQDSSTSAGSTIVAWAWDFGDGGTSNLQNPSHAYAIPGNYIISLTVTDANGCTGLSTLPITVPAPPVANFIVSDTLGCPGLFVTFTGDTTGGIVLFEWDFGDGSPLQTGNPVSHAYNNPGDYTVTLIVENSLGCRDTIVRPQLVRIHPPVADFLQSAVDGCPPLSVTFTSLSTGQHPAFTLDWDFGDGNSGTGTPVNHTYLTPGVYTVTLIVTDSLGCRDTLVKPNLITVFQPPLANFGITDTLNCQPFTIQLTDSTTSAFPITAWDWTFGDGGTSTVQNPSHAYPNLGTYTITLITTDANGCQDTASLAFTVPVRPTANFVADDSAGCTPFAVTFTADSVDIAGYFWTFGDGATSNIGPTVVHSYLFTGHYTVTLIITDVFGCTDTLTKPDYIFVDSLSAQFLADVGAGCPPLPVTFTDQSFSDTTIVSWLWDFGDGNTSTQQNPVHIYTTPGSYTILLTVTNAIGCTDTVSLPNFVVYNIDPPAVPPILMATVEDDTRDSIAWRASLEPDFDHYVLWWEQPTNSNTWVPVDSFYNRLDTTYTHLGLNTLGNSYCYRLQVVDICGYRSALDSSRKHCTIDLEASPGIDQAILNWNAYVGWDSVLVYDIYRVTNYDTLQAQYLGTVPGGVTTYIDSAVICYDEYCYRVQAREFGGFEETSWSDTSCARPIHIPNPDPLYICAASVLNDTFVELQWTIPTNARVVMVLLDKSLDGQNWFPLVQLPGASQYYVDTHVSVHSQSYYYRVSMIDSCGDLGPYSNIGRTILLETALQQGLPHLDWNAYAQWTNGVQSYDIEVFNDATQAWQPVTTGAGGVTDLLDLITNLDQPIYCYRLYGNENGGTCRSLSNTSCIPVGPTLYAPNAFTPNGDGINEFFELKGHFIAEYHFMLYDRWGALIFESYDLGYHWDGTWRKKACQEGVYVWVAMGRGFDGTVIERRGSCTLIR